jgi:NADH:ubiquinone reductase (H+-translocating)
MYDLLIIGGGFAGVWSAIAAARAREEIGYGPASVGIALVSRDPYLTIRPRLYEADLTGVQVSLDSVLAPIGVERIAAEVTGIDPEARAVTLDTGSVRRSLEYRRLVLAAGSRLHRPEVPRSHPFTRVAYSLPKVSGFRQLPLCGPPGCAPAHSPRTFP